MTDLNSSLEAEVRRAEPDLWLASRLVGEPAARARLIALYALHVELAKVSSAASNPLAGEIRLAWWREELEALFAASRPLGHPALSALQGARGLDAAALHAMIEARHAELEPRPFADEAALLAYLDGVNGGVMRAAAGLLSPSVPASVTQAARAWGWARLLRDRSAWRARGRDWAPTAWGEASDAEIAGHVRHRVADALSTARNEAAAPVAAFPALAYVALASPHALGRSLSELEKRTRLVWASLRGKI
jgi:phytoene synthase